MPAWDGLVRVLVAVLTGRNELRSEQLENYLEVARRNGL